MTTLLLATRNAHKTEEIRNILGKGFRYLTLDDFPSWPPVIEDADSFVGNARKKAIALAKYLSEHPSLLLAKTGEERGSLLILADDSGLEVDALNGGPGIHSARFAALDAGAPGNSPDSANNAKLLRLLATVPTAQRTARFRCVLALTRIAISSSTKNPLPSSDSLEAQTSVFEGICEGRITGQSEGNGGFGYDPLFVPVNYHVSFAALAPSIKNELSHRAQALEKLRNALL